MTQVLRVASVLLGTLCASSLAPVFAQGSDSCAAPQPLAGPGVFAFDTTAATTGSEGQSEASCLFFGQTGIANDVWFTWTAMATGPVQIQTCGFATFDTKIAVYSGVGCPAAAAIACNDDSCGLQTKLSFAATLGSTYTIQVGRFPGAAGTSGSFEVTPIAPPSILTSAVNPANGRTYHMLTPSSWTAAQSAAVSLGGHLATVDDQAEHDWIVATFHDFQGIARDLWIGFNDAGVEGQFTWVSGASSTFTNWDTGEPNNANAGEDYAIIRKNNPLGFWNDLPDEPSGFHNSVHGVVEVGGGAITAFCFGDGTLGTACPCANFGAAGSGCENSVGTGGAVLSATGATVPDTLVLTSSGETPTALSIFLQGSANLPSGVVFGDGVRCVAGLLKRIAVRAAAGGVVSYPSPGDPSISSVSSTLGDPIAPGSSRWYQVYYRDASATFCPAPPGNTWNVSGGLEVDW